MVTGLLSPAVRRWVPALAGVMVALGLVAVVVALSYYADAKAQLEADARVRASLGEARDAIDRRLETALAVPETLAAVIAAERGIEPRTFSAIAERLIVANASIRNVALAPDNVITAVYPVQGNEAALGLRYADRPEQYAGVLQAMQRRRTVVVGPIGMVQGGSGLLSRTPVFLSTEGDAPGTRYWGIVALAVDTDRLFEDIARIARRDGIDIAVRALDRVGRPGRVFAGEPQVFERAPVLAGYPLPGGDGWQLGAAPTRGWQAVVGLHPMARALLYALALLLGWIAYRVVASRNHNRELARRDPLTGLANRAAFEHRLQAMLSHKSGSCALILVDLDAFKPVNDTCGHRSGDLVLQQVADRLRRLVRASDTVYRLGGDEFAILLQDIRAGQDMLPLAERAIDRIRAPIALEDGRSTGVGASIGIAVFPLGGRHERAQDVFNRADRALYRGKTQGGGRAHSEPETLPPVAAPAA